MIVNIEKRTYRIVNFAVPADGRLKIKQSEKEDKYLDLARELKYISNLIVAVITIVIVALGKSPKGREDLEIRGRVGTIKIKWSNRLVL